MQSNLLVIAERLRQWLRLEFAGKLFVLGLPQLIEPPAHLG